VFLLLIITFSQTAFGEIDEDVIIEDIIVNPTTIDLICTDPEVTGSTIITGYRVDIDDSEFFDSINIIDVTPKTCDEITLNSISISSLSSDTDYNLRLTVLTNNAGDSIETDTFTTLDISQL